MADLVWTSRIEALCGLDEMQLKTTPASYGVVCLRDGDDTVIALASTGDMRSFLADRIGPSAEGSGDLRAVVASVETVQCGSLFEADLSFMTACALLDPGLHDRVTRKLRIWWLGTHTDGLQAAWSWETDPAEFESWACVIGPFYEKAGVRRHAERLDSVFELCRYPAELHRAPNGRSCAYKEMGKCPGACDGSESMGLYEQRLGRAVALNLETVQLQRNDIEVQMIDAARSHDFELAKALKDASLAWGVFDDRQIGALGRFDEMTYAVISRSGVRDEARLMVIDRGRWALVGQIAAESTQAARIALVAHARGQAGVLRTNESYGDLGVIGVLGREMLQPSRGGPVLVRLDGLDESILLQAAKKVLRITSTKPRNQASDE